MSDVRHMEGGADALERLSDDHMRRARLARLVDLTLGGRPDTLALSKSNIFIQHDQTKCYH